MADYRKIMVHRIDPMDKQALQTHWSRLKRRVYPFVFRNLGTKLCPYEAFEDRRYFAQWLKESFGFGHFNIYSWKEGYYSKKHKKDRLRPYKIAEIEIKEGLPPNFIDLTRISRFKWWEASRKREKLISKHQDHV